MAHPTRAACSYGTRHGVANEPFAPHGLDQKNLHHEAQDDAVLAEALRIARERYGDNHPLVRDALRSLRFKERRRVSGSGDGLTGAILSAQHGREKTLSKLLTTMLGEPPIHEAVLPGFGAHRVDMHFPGHRLVVEENGQHHDHEPRTMARDAELRTLCRTLGIALLEINHREDLTTEHLGRRLKEAGIDL